MQRSAWIFLAAILLPSLALAWMAVRSVRDQQVLLEHQQAIISQGVTDTLAAQVQGQMDQVRSDFVAATAQLLAQSSPTDLAGNFDARLRAAWPLAEVGFAVGTNGEIYSPQLFNGDRARIFRTENGRFLSNREPVTVYFQNASQLLKNMADSQAATASQGYDEAATRRDRQIAETTTDASAIPQAAAPAKADLSAAKAISKTEASSALLDDLKKQGSIAQATDSDSLTQAAPAPNAALSSSNIMTAQAAAPVARQVVPQQMEKAQKIAISNTRPEESDFRSLIGGQASGSLARFLENQLRLMVWSHPAETPALIFGAQIDQTRLVQRLRAAFPPTDSDVCLALLDDKGHPVALSLPGFQGDWKHPFVATEIGEALPHWEAALYLVHPDAIGRSARTLRLTLGLIVLVLVAAIAAGGTLIATDIRRQVRLAQQKTDFVSNVSHELKTPLTSIRMFADLLAERRVPDEARQAAYLRIISAESARLTRLINNVLDFARLERGTPPGERRACDLVEAVRDVVETCGPHLETAGISFQMEIEAENLPLQGDRDALAQIILNLVSNAEKYGGNDVLVRVRRQETSAGTLGCVDVLDRGPGIAPAQMNTIFEPFHRLDDSLASGIPGSGLGLTLARRMARAHGGDVTYSPRAGGGSCFTLAVPLTG